MVVCSASSLYALHHDCMQVSQGSNFSAMTVLHFLALDILVFGLLAAYLDKVLPTSPSKPEHPLFFLRYFKASKPPTLMSLMSNDVDTQASRSAVATQKLHRQGQEVESLTDRNTSLSQSASRTGLQASFDILHQQNNTSGTTQLDNSNRHNQMILTNKLGSTAADCADGMGYANGPGLQVRQLVKIFPGNAGSGPVAALQGATLDVKPGTITALLGHNG